MEKPINELSIKDALDSFLSLSISSLTCYIIAQTNPKTKAMFTNWNISQSMSIHFFYYNTNFYKDKIVTFNRSITLIIFEIRLIIIYVFIFIQECNNNLLSSSYKQLHDRNCRQHLYD